MLLFERHLAHGFVGGFMISNVRRGFVDGNDGLPLILRRLSFQPYPIHLFLFGRLVLMYLLYVLNLVDLGDGGGGWRLSMTCSGLILLFFSFLFLSTSTSGFSKIYQSTHESEDYETTRRISTTIFYIYVELYFSCSPGLQKVETALEK